MIVVVTAVLEYRRIPSRAIIAFLVAVAVGQNLLANGIKLLVDRARPEVGQLTGFSGSSFPSGHSTAAAAVLAGVALVVSRRRSPRVRAVIAGAAGTGAAVATTRVFLGVHWLTDVMAGLALGWAWFARARSPSAAGSCASAPPSSWPRAWLPTRLPRRGERRNDRAQTSARNGRGRSATCPARSGWPGGAAAPPALVSRRLDVTAVHRAAPPARQVGTLFDELAEPLEVALGSAADDPEQVADGFDDPVGLEVHPQLHLRAVLTHGLERDGAAFVAPSVAAQATTWSGSWRTIVASHVRWTPPISRPSAARCPRAARRWSRPP